MVIGTYGRLLLFGLGGFVGPGDRSSDFSGLDLLGTIGLGLGDFTGDGLAAAPAGSPLGPPFFFLLVLLIGRFGNLDNYLTTVEVRLVEGLDSFLCGLCGSQSDETIASGAGATEDDVGRYAS